jgi:hypothetical protein
MRAIHDHRANLVSASTIQRLAVANAVVIAGLMIARYYFVVSVWRVDGFSAAFTFDVWVSPIVLLLVGMGTLIVYQRPGNAIGIGMCVEALCLGVFSLADGYAAYGIERNPGSLPGPEYAVWLTEWLWVPAVMPLLTFLLLLCPDGSLLSVRWRTFARFVGINLIVLAVTEAFVPGPTEGFPSVENPFGVESIGPFIEAVQFVGYVLMLPSILGSTYSMVSRFRHATGIERQQLKWFVSAGVATFTLFIAAWIISLAAAAEPWDLPVVGGAMLMTLATGIAVLRYRLYEIDVIINRALVYGTLTALLAGVYAASLQLFKILFTTATGDRSDTAVVLTTLVLAALFTPAKNRLQALVDRYFSRKPDPRKELQQFQDELATVLKVLTPEIAAEEFVGHALHALETDAGALYMSRAGVSTLLYASETPVDEMSASITVPLLAGAGPVGWLLLGARRDGAAYEEEDIVMLSAAGSMVARAILLGDHLHAGTSGTVEMAAEPVVS